MSTAGDTPEVGDIFRQYGSAFLDAFGESTSAAQRHVLDALAACRTSALGGHVDECDECGHPRISYNSCTNRHCPKCLVSGSAEWLDARKVELLPVQYFHVVFTLPAALASLALQNKKVVYDLLFEATSKTLQEIAADPKHLGVQLGFLAILHSWGQILLHHPGWRPFPRQIALDFLSRGLLSAGQSAQSPVPGEVLAPLAESIRPEEADLLRITRNVGGALTL
jgi:hypothetical protein